MENLDAFIASAQSIVDGLTALKNIPAPVVGVPESEIAKVETEVAAVDTELKADETATA